MAEELKADALELSIRPIAPVRAHEEIVNQLRDLMERGALRPGDRLPPERQLAVRFGVSRATVREAISALQSAGLVESLVGRGTFARLDAGGAGVTKLVEALRLAQGTLGDQMEVRRMIEPEAARWAAVRALDSDRQGFQRSIEQQRACVGQHAAFLEADSAFHLAIARATRNPVLVKMVEGIHGLLRDTRERSLHTGEGAQRSLDGHLRIADALLASDGQAARDAMVEHLLDVERLSLEALANPTP